MKYHPQDTHSKGQHFWRKMQSGWIFLYQIFSARAQVADAFGVGADGAFQMLSACAEGDMALLRCLDPFVAQDVFLGAAAEFLERACFLSAREGDAEAAALPPL